MPSTSRRELVIANVKSTLEGISTDADYNFDLKKVLRFRKSGFQIYDFPTILLFEPEEEKEFLSPTQYTSSLTMILECWLKETDNMSLDVNKMIADVEKAMMVDNTRGGYATDTHIAGNRSFVDETEGPYGGVQIEILIRYRASITDPSAL